MVSATRHVALMGWLLVLNTLRTQDKYLKSNTEMLFEHFYLLEGCIIYGSPEGSTTPTGKAVSSTLPIHFQFASLHYSECDVGSNSREQ